MHTDSTPKGDLVKLQRGLLSEPDARAMLERIRWPNGVVCIYCGGTEVYHIEVKGKTYPNGRVVQPRHLLKCKACKKQFSVTKGTAFEDSKISLTTWITVMFRMCSSKKGISAHQIMREYGLTYESAWFMCHRIRWMMTEKDPTPLSGIVEADETYVGGKQRGHIEVRRATMTQGQRVKAGIDKKTPVFGIKERGGRVRAGVMPQVNRMNAEAALLSHIDTKNAMLITDEALIYNGIARHLPHGIIRHRSEYVRGAVHTNNIEGFWSHLKHQIESTHHHVDAGYLNMYVQEQAYRHNTRQVTDAERFATLMGQIDGRLDWYVGQQAKDASESGE